MSPRETFLMCVICLMVGGFLVHMRTSSSNTMIVEDLPAAVEAESSEEQLREERLTEAMAEAEKQRALEPCPAPVDPVPCPDPVPCTTTAPCPACAACPPAPPAPAPAAVAPTYLCPNAFVDLGSNRGDSILKFFEPEKHGGPFAEFIKSQNWNPAKFCVFGFEGNPVFNASLEKLVTDYKSKVIHMEVFTQTLAHEKDGTVSFYLDTVNTGQHFWGSSVLAHHPDVIKSGGPQKVEIKARAINVGAFLQKRVDPAGVLAVKMDIEGGEYGVLADLVTSGRLCAKDAAGNNLFDFFNLEYHAWTPSATASGSPMPTVDQYRQTVNWMITSCGIKLSPHTD